MINIEYRKCPEPEETKYHIRITGHSDYADYGRDIVCAAVSGIVTAAVQQLLYYYREDDISHFDFDLSEGSGWLDVRIRYLDPAAGQAYGVLDTLYTGLEMISGQYPENVAISTL